MWIFSFLRGFVDRWVFYFWGCSPRRSSETALFTVHGGLEISEKKKVTDDAKSKHKYEPFHFFSESFSDYSPQGCSFVNRTRVKKPSSLSYLRCFVSVRTRPVKGPTIAPENRHFHVLSARLYPLGVCAQRSPFYRYSPRTRANLVRPSVEAHL